MSAEPIDTIAFTQRLVELLDTGRRNSTYKLATLLALIDVCVENEPADDGTLAIPVQELAHRVIAYYWPQVRPFALHGVLSQNQSVGRSIPTLVADFKWSSEYISAEAAREHEDPAYLRLVRTIELVIAQQPLAHFHTVTGRRTRDTRNDFVFDAGAFHKKMTRSEFTMHNLVVLRHGVALALRNTSTLLKSFIKNAWVADVVRLNRTELEAEDVEGFLFGAERVALTRLTDPLRELQNNRCFYCDRVLTGVAHIDHVIPWTRIPIDGVANLVAADSRCNLDKSASIPIRAHVDRALLRSPSELGSVSRSARFPVLLRRTKSASDGIYASLPEGVPLWVRGREYAPLVCR